MPTPAATSDGEERPNAPALDRLRGVIETVETIEGEIKDLNEQKAETYSGAKAAGFDVKVIKIILRRRRRDKDDLAEEENLINVYERALAEVKT